MSLKPAFELMADYNCWMNGNISRACSALSAAEMIEDRGAFFGSISGTLNHMLVGDTIWLQRFGAHLPTLICLDPVRQRETPTALDAILYTDLEELNRARKALDAVIVAFIAALSEAMIAAPVAYTNFRGQPCRKQLGQLLLHFFNHQTHHRGQVSTLLSQAGVDVGVTDLLVKIPECQ